MPLVEHRENRIRLTPQGERFYGYAEKDVEHLLRRRRRIFRPRAFGRHRAHCGGEPIVGLSFSQLFWIFRAVPQGSRQCADDLLRARAGMDPPAGSGHWLCARNGTLLPDPSCACLPLYNEPILFVTTEKNPLAGKGQVLWRDLENQKVCLHLRRLLLYHGLPRPAAPAKRAARFRTLFRQRFGCYELRGAGGAAIALIPRSSFQRLRCPETLYCLNWQEEPIRPWVQILYDKNRRLAPAEKELIAQAQSYARTLIAEDPEGEIYA